MAKNRKNRQQRGMVNIFQTELRGIAKCFQAGTIGKYGASQ
jgi:hypothetical protein